jgi:hypothetical protein
MKLIWHAAIRTNVSIIVENLLRHLADDPIFVIVQHLLPSQTTKNMIIVIVIVSCIKLILLGA